MCFKALQKRGEFEMEVRSAIRTDNASQNTKGYT